MKKVLFLLLFVFLFFDVMFSDDEEDYYELENETSIVQQSGEYDDTVENVYYEWEYGGYNWYYDFPIAMADIGYYESRERDVSSYDYVYSDYVEDTRDDTYLKGIADNLERMVSDVGWDKSEAVNLAVSFVQSLEYISEGEGEEYPKYPFETIYDGGGDCEDTSILLAAILKEMGYGCCMIGFEDHAAVGILSDDLYGVYYELDGNRYYYIETTNTGWEIGALPDRYNGKEAKIYPFD